MLSVKSLEQAIGYLKHLRDTSEEEGRTWIWVGKIWIKISHWTKAQDALHEAKNLFLASNVEEHFGELYHLWGVICQGEHQWVLAMENYQKALEWEDKTGNQFDLGGTYHQIANLYADQGQWEPALENYQRALKWFDKTGNQFIGGTYHQIGDTYAAQQQWEAALHNYQKAIEWYEKTGNEFQLAKTYYNIGAIYEQQHNYTAAYDQYEYAWELAEKWDVEPIIKDMILTALARIHNKISTEDDDEFKVHSLQERVAAVTSPASLASIRETLANNHESAITQAEEFLQDHELTPNALAEAHLLAGIAYGQRAGKTTRSNPEIEHLHAAYEQAKSLLLEGNTGIVELYLEIAYYQIASLQKTARGFFGSKKAKQEIAGLRAEARQLTAELELSEAARGWFSKIEGS